MISIIIPHHNDLTNLINLINTIPKNDRYEVIVVDDHSEVNFKEVKIEVQKVYPNAKVYKNDTSIKSAGKARNIGIDNAIGEWLLFADSDDTFLSSLDTVLAEYENSEADIVYFSPKSKNLDNNTVSDYKDRYSDLINKYDNSENKEMAKWEIRLTFDVPWSKLIRKSIVTERNIRFDEVIRHNDTIFSQKIGIFSSDIKIDNRSIYCVSKNSNSLSNKVTNIHFYSMVDVNIRSIILKKRYVDYKILDKANPSLDCQPMRLVLSSLKHTHNLFFSLSLVRLYKDNDIDVFTLNNIVKFMKNRN